MDILYSRIFYESPIDGTLLYVILHVEQKTINS